MNRNLDKEMRTAQEFLTRQLNALHIALKRPGQFCSSGKSADLFFKKLLENRKFVGEKLNPIRNLKKNQKLKRQARPL